MSSQENNTLPRLWALGNIHLEPFGFSQTKPLVLLAYVALEGEQSRDHLRELFFPNASDAAGSLRSTINRVRQILPTAFEGSGSRLKAGVACDAAEVLFALEHQDLERAVELYTAPFLENLEISDVHQELLEWAESMRAYLARGVIEAHLILAERAVERAVVDQHLEAVRNIGGFDSLEPAWLQRIAKLENLNLETAKLLVIPNNLGQSLTSFIGRARESAHILELLQEEARLVTLVGPGGVGKTRLALETARQSLQLEVFKDGVLMVMLEAINDLEALLSRIVQVLKLNLKPDAPVLEQIMESIGQRQILLVLDNFEHLIEHGFHLTSLLERCSNLRLIVTSRERLNLHSEWITPLEGLSAGSDQDAALELFLDRAGRIGKQVQTTDDRTDALEICKLVHGFPLAIELAVPLLRALSLIELRQDLAYNLDLLDNTLRDTPERHRSIRAVFEHSWKMLTPPEQHALAQLAVFRGGATREAIGAINATKLQTLANLTDKSLVQRDETNRFGIHPLLYQFTFQKLLELPDHDSSVKRHQDYYLTKLERDTAEIRGSEAATAMRNIETELENIRAAWSHAIQNNQAARLEKVQDLVVFFDQRSRYAEGLIWFEEAIAKLEMEVTAPLALAGMLVGAGWLHYRLRQSQQAEHKAQRAADLARAMGEIAEEVLSKALNTLAAIALFKHNYSNAVLFGEEALTLAKKVGDVTREAICLINLASHEVKLQLFQKAKERYELALAIAEHTKNDRIGILVYLNLGNLLIFNEENKNYSEIILLLKSGLSLAEVNGDILTITHFHWLLSLSYFNISDFEKSKILSEITYEKALKMNIFDIQVATLFTLGRIALVWDQTEQARSYFLIGLKLAHKIDDVPQILDALIYFADLESHLGHSDRAIRYLHSALNHPLVQDEQKKQSQAVFKRLGIKQPQISRDTFSKNSVTETVEGLLNEQIVA
jgi:predicted ATPase/predicted negative regulator of RcsB-dependent stress response